MATIYDGINYFPVGVNFMEENAMEVIEAKYGIKGSAIVLNLWTQTVLLKQPGTGYDRKG